MVKSKNLFNDDEAFNYVNSNLIKAKKRNLDSNYFSDENMDIHFFQKKGIFDSLTNWNNKEEKDMANKLGFTEQKNRN